MIKAVFSWDDPAISFEGYYNPETDWNGYVVPYFNLSTVKDIADLCNVYRREDETQKVFRILDGTQVMELDNDQSSIINPVVINGVEYFQIGGYEWTWSVIEQEGEVVV